jgi:hypothetical protein
MRIGSLSPRIVTPNQMPACLPISTSPMMTAPGAIQLPARSANAGDLPSIAKIPMRPPIMSLPLERIEAPQQAPGKVLMIESSPALSGPQAKQVAPGRGKPGGLPGGALQPGSRGSLAGTPHAPPAGSALPIVSVS